MALARSRTGSIFQRPATASSSALSSPAVGQGIASMFGAPAFQAHAIGVVADLGDLRAFVRGQSHFRERGEFLDFRFDPFCCWRPAPGSTSEPRFAPGRAGGSRYRRAATSLGHVPPRSRASGRSSRRPPRPSRRGETSGDRAARIGDPV